MFISLDDFRIKSSNFDLANPWNVLRVICGAFMFPHVASKFAGVGLSAGTVGFFAKAGFYPPEA
jgi:putative oxidoreductase